MIQVHGRPPRPQTQNANQGSGIDLQKQTVSALNNIGLYGHSHIYGTLKGLDQIIEQGHLMACSWCPLHSKVVTPSTKSTLWRLIHKKWMMKSTLFVVSCCPKSSKTALRGSPRSTAATFAQRLVGSPRQIAAGLNL